MAAVAVEAAATAEAVVGGGASITSRQAADAMYFWTASRPVLVALRSSSRGTRRRTALSMCWSESVSFFCSCNEEVNLTQSPYVINHTCHVAWAVSGSREQEARDREERKSLRAHLALGRYISCGGHKCSSFPREHGHHHPERRA